LITTRPILKKNTVRSYQAIIERYIREFGDGPVDQVTPEHVLTFLNRLTEGNKPYTKRIRFSQLSSFFNFVRNNIDPELRNPCDRLMIRKLYRERVPLRWKIIEKETIDEIIFRTTKVRNRLILELMARGGMRIGEVLKLQLGDLQDRKLVLREPKSGKEYEFVFIPQKVADRLREYALQVCKASRDRIFPISYEAARMMVIKSGKLVGIKLRPHDLRRHSATFASRSGVPIEIISKVILRHANLSTTQRYLGTISDIEAIRWIENIYGVCPAKAGIFSGSQSHQGRSQRPCSTNGRQEGNQMF
jgi:integrase/recombinase XerD